MPIYGEQKLFLFTPLMQFKLVPLLRPCQPRKLIQMQCMQEKKKKEDTP